VARTPALFAACLAAVLGLSGEAVAADDAARPGAGPAATETAAAPGPAVVEADGERYITMDFQDVDLGVLVKFMGEITGKNFVMDERVQGKVTVVSPTKITPEEAYQVFQSVLQVKGFTTVPSGAVIRIIPTKDAKSTSLRTLTEEGGRMPSEEYITRFVPLRQVDVGDVINVLQPLVSPDGLITGSPQTNALVLVDSAANIERLIHLLQQLDVASSRRQTQIFHIKHAAVGELVDTIQQAMDERLGPPGQAAPGKPAAGSAQLRVFKLTPDERTNTLVVSAAVEQMQQIRALVERLDVPLPPGAGRVNVFYLRYASAEDLLPVLLDVIGSTGSARTSQTQQQQTAGRDRRQKGSSLRRAYSARPHRQPTAPGQQPAQQSAIDFAGDIRITADPATNSLIIAATPEDYAVLVGVIEKLDIRRRQVYVEAIILEISLDRMRQLGIELQGGVGMANGVGVARTNLGGLNKTLLDPAQLSGLVAAALSKQTVKLPDGTTVPAQVALLTALQNDREVNILSAPNILTTDNEEAEIIVGQNVPFVASRSTDTTNLANTFQTVEREDVGITLRLTPQISEGSIVRLALFEEVSAIIPNPLLDANEVGPTTTVRSTSTTITVKDSQTVVIGGLISDAMQSSEDKVPFLGDLPVLGNFFKSTGTTKSKINLLIFLTPHIIKDEEDAAAVSVAERDRFRNIQDQAGGPRRYPDPLDKPSFELPEDRDLPAPEDAAPDAGDTPDGTGHSLALGAVHVDRRNDGAVIRLDLGAAPTRIGHYALSDPGRYVLDAFGASQETRRVDVVPVIDPLVRRVRVANHRGRMRVVVDLATSTPPAYALEHQNGTIALTLGTARGPVSKPNEPSD